MSRGVGDLCPQLVRAWHGKEISCIQFLRGGRVRVTVREPAFREELLSRDFVYEGRKIPVTPAGAHTTIVDVRDLPVELSDESVKSALSAYGDVYSIRHACFKEYPELRNGNRLLLMSVSTPIPSSFNVLGFVCRTWYSGQPVTCSICKEPDHLPRACPLSGLCRLCKQPGHVARECGQTGGQPRPSSSVPDPDPDPVPSPVDPVSVPVPGSVDDGDLSSISSDHTDPPDPVPVPPYPSLTVDNIPRTKHTKRLSTQPITDTFSFVFAVMPFARSVVLHFPAEIHRTQGESEVAPQILQALDVENIAAVQYLKNCQVHVTCKTAEYREDILKGSTFLFGDVPIPVTAADKPIRSVFVRDLPFEVRDRDCDAKSAFESFDVVLSVHQCFFRDFPSVANGTRRFVMSFRGSVPSSVSVADIPVRVFRAGQPVICSIYHESCHLPQDCPFSGLCLRCKQPGHMARKCTQPWGPSSPSPPLSTSSAPVSSHQFVSSVPSSMASLGT